MNRGEHRGGFDYWLDQMEHGMSRSTMLVAFSESHENKMNVAGAVSHGVWLDGDYFI